jgi:hypothetical protein
MHACPKNPTTLVVGVVRIDKNVLLKEIKNE